MSTVVDSMILLNIDGIDVRYIRMSTIVDS